MKTASRKIRSSSAKAKGKIARRPSRLRKLQQTLGNSAFQQLTTPSASAASSSPTLTVDSPNSVAELEADRVAERVLKQPEQGVHSAGNVGVQKSHAISRKTTGQGTPAVSASLSAEIHGQRGSGDSLSRVDRDFFEPRLGHDLSAIRLHTGSFAAKSAAELNAKAYTVGTDVFYGSGQQAAGGRALLAHELVHTLQQGGVVRRKAASPEPSVDSQVTRGISFISQKLGHAEMHAEPDSLSPVMATLLEGQRIRRVGSGKPLPSGWAQCVSESPLGGVVGFVRENDLLTPKAELIQMDPGLRLVRVRQGDTFWGLVKREYGVSGNESTADLNINHFINAVRAVNKPEAFAVKEDLLDRVGNSAVSGRDASDTELITGMRLWIPSYAAAVRMDVGSGTATGEVARVRKKIEQKLGDFRDALVMSGSLFLDSMQSMSEQLGSQLIDGLLKFVKEAAIILAGSTAVGALVGAVLGGGFGAAQGAKIGFEVGIVILQAYGIYEAVVGGISVLKLFFGKLGSAIGATWNANGDATALKKAAKLFAEAFATLVTVLLAVLFAFLLKKGFNAIKGTRFAKTVGESRLAQWFARRRSASRKKALLHDRLSKIGHTTPWNKMTKAQRKAFQHSYSRHAKDLGLPNWSQKNAESLRQLFNNTVGHIRKNGVRIGNPPKKPFNGQLVDVNFYEATFRGTKYYYYETLDGIFISAGKAR